MSATAHDASSALEVLARVEAQSGRPLSAMLELSDRCNEVCVHCYQVQGQKGELGTGDWKRVLQELSQAGVLMLTLSGGEVTLRSDFLEIVAYARQLGFAVRIFTNGLTMTRELAASLADLHVLDVEISVYSARAAVHDFVTGVPGAFDKTLRGIRHLRELGVAVTIKTVVMSVNEAELSDYPAFADSLGVRYRLDTGGVVPREGYDRAPQALNPQGASIQRLERQLQGRRGPSKSAQLDPGLPAGRKPAASGVCGAGNNLYVEPNGELRPCSLLEVDLGDVRAGGTLHAFESAKAQQMRGLRWGQLHGCRVCELARWCARCHATALAETGDALGPHPGGCERARDRAQAAADATLRFVGRSAPGLGDPADGQIELALGPYRQIAPSVYEAFDDPRTSEDEALAQRLGWTRRSPTGKRAPDLAVRPGQLVQIRRPGRKASRLELVPGDDRDDPPAPRTKQPWGRQETDQAGFDKPVVGPNVRVVRGGSEG